MRTAITNTNVNRPKGFLELDDRHWQILDNDQAIKADDYKPLLIRYCVNGVAGAPVGCRHCQRLGAGRRARSVRPTVSPRCCWCRRREPGANIIKTVDSCAACCRNSKRQIPASMKLSVAVRIARSTIRALQLSEVERLADDLGGIP